jgi:antirestriction protein ArdC
MTVYEMVSERLLPYLETNVLPWRKPWQDDSPMQLPINAKTNKAYQGVNVMLLWLQGKQSPRWATEKTWGEMGAIPKPNEVPTEIYFCSYRDKRPFFCTYEVYNFTQVDGCEYLFDCAVATDYAPAEELIRSTGAFIRWHDSAYYDIGQDTIYCPRKDQFGKQSGYYTTMLHELAHWTGHESRLNRVFGIKQSPDYAMEELIAELASCFLAASIGVPEALDEMPNHASYISQWLLILKQDHKAIFTAANAAQKVVKYLLPRNGLAYV